jgi:pimeloyl-ACP methyl ester carboxylesterase
MQVLFVHGMGRSPLSGWPLLRRLRSAGFSTDSFGHCVSLESSDGIIRRLEQRLVQMAAAGPYVLVGHSLGGVLLRQSLRDLPATVRRPERLFLLGSPVQTSSLAARLGRNRLYGLLTGDSGRMLGSPERMAAIGTPTVPVTAIVGIKGWSVMAGLLPGEANDGIVTVAETSAPWLTDVVQVGVTHTFLPSDARVTREILARLRAPGA